METQDIQQYQRGMVAMLKEKGHIKTPQVENAFLNVPRYVFIPGYPLEQVYKIDEAIVTRKGSQGEPTSSCSAPDIMVIMLEMLDLQPGQSALEVGAATGYNAALMAAIVGPEGKVVTIDIQPDLVESAREHLDAAGFASVQVIAGDGGYGYPEGAPYDRIILTVCPWTIAPAWREQLKTGGRLVLPFDFGGYQKVIAFERRGDDLVSVAMSECVFMAIQGTYARPAPIFTQVGSDPRLQFVSDKELPLEAERLAQWLTLPSKDWASGVTARLQELIIGSFIYIDGIHPKPGEFVGLLAKEELADQTVIPAILGYGGQAKKIYSVLLLGPDGCAALMRPPGLAVPLIDPANPAQDEQPFEIYVRQLGPGENAARCMVSILQEWGLAGKPTVNNITMRAVPAEKEVVLSDGEYLVERPNTKFVARVLNA